MVAFKSFLSALPLLAPLASAQVGGQCPPADPQQPNPIANQYTTQTTGTLNSTIAIVPITMSLARSIIPSQYGILTNQIKEWLPNLGSGNYPAMVQIEKFHNIYSKGKSLGSGADYLQAQVMFPFVDRLGDGHTAMTYSDQVIVSESATSAQSLLKAAGYTVSPGYFANCNPYEYENATSNLKLPPSQRSIDQASWAETNTNLGNPDIAYRFTPSASSPYSINFYYNVTNQPVFAKSSSLCQNMVRLYNTKVSLSPFAPIRMYGNVSALNPYLPPKSKTIWTGVYGMKLDVAYHTAGNVQCSSLKGFHVNSA